MTTLERYFHYALLIALGFLVFIAVINAFFSSFIKAEWFLAGIFSALFAITFYCFKIPHTESRLRNTNGKVSESRVQRFDTYEKFYGALQESLRRATTEVLLTHIRHEPPLSFTRGAEYFGLVDKWAIDHPEGIVLRLAAAPNEEMANWANEEKRKSNCVANYYFRVIEWPLSFAFINMAIIDGQEVYLALTAGEIERTRGICINDVQIVNYFRDYYHVLWQRTR